MLDKLFFFFFFFRWRKSHLLGNLMPAECKNYTQLKRKASQIWDGGPEEVKRGVIFDEWYI